MIVGVGVDIVEIGRIRRLVARFGCRFTEKVFTSAERREAAERRDPSAYYAGRWAVKEAVSKALGCGIGSRCELLDVECRGAGDGRPYVNLTGAASETLRSIGGGKVHVSLTHEAQYAVADVIVESDPESAARPSAGTRRPQVPRG